ncbi:MAG: hypothetical protein KIT45_00355 [Fimbriimonadia bacterium]|nr:hypothetical protein [Fimbriimonadia bacterium]
MTQNQDYSLDVQYQEQGEVRPTLIVGLGGSGVYTARRLKRLLQDRYKVKGLIRFLYLDTDQGQFQNEPRLADADPEEIVTISIQHPEQIVEEWKRKSELHPYLSFLDSRVDVGVLRNADGAAGIRPVGRFAFHASFDHIYPSLRNALQQIMQVGEQVKALMETVPYEVKVLGHRPRIYVLTSLCGGTGSGIFFDATLVLRQILESLNLDGEIVGVFYLPSVFDGEAGISHNLREVIQANAYASLIELEYFCNPNNLKAGEWKVPYRMISEIEIKEAIFDEPYLIERSNSDAKVLQDKQEVYEMVARSLLMDIGSPLGARARSAKRNSLAVIDAIRCPETDESRLFASLAVASASVPVKELTEYCALKVMCDTLNSRETADKEQHDPLDVRNFLNRNGLAPETILDALKKGLISRDVTIDQDNLKSSAENFIGLLDDDERESDDVLKSNQVTVMENAKEAIEKYCSNFIESSGQEKLEDSLEALNQQVDKAIQEINKESQNYKKKMDGVEQRLESKDFYLLKGWSTKDKKKKKADSIKSELTDYRDARLHRKLAQKILEIYSKENSLEDNPSIKAMIGSKIKNLKAKQKSHDDVLNRLQERLQEFETRIPGGTDYALEQLVCLQRHFARFYEEHKAAFRRCFSEVEITGTQEPGELLRGTLKRVILAISKEVRSKANVLEFLKPLEDEAENEDREYLKRKLDCLMQISQPFWSTSQPPGGIHYEQFVAISVPYSRANQGLRSDEQIRDLDRMVEGLVKNAGVQLERVKDGYPFALTVMRRTYGARAYYLRSIQQMEHSYLRRSEHEQVRVHLHLDSRFADLPLLTPSIFGEIYWVLALAFGYIAEVNGHYYFGIEKIADQRLLVPLYRSQRKVRASLSEELLKAFEGIYITPDEQHRLGTTYDQARERFMRQRIFVDQVHDAFRTIEQAIGHEKMTAFLREYLQPLQDKANDDTLSEIEQKRYREERDVLNNYLNSK